MQKHAALQQPSYFSRTRNADDSTSAPRLPGRQLQQASYSNSILPGAHGAGLLTNQDSFRGHIPQTGNALSPAKANGAYGQPARQGNYGAYSNA